MRDHTKLRAFQLADQVALRTYEATRNFPSDERFGLAGQLRRAAVSAPSNIVEGASRSSESDYVRFLEIAYGSLRELNYQFSLAVRLGFGDRDEITELRVQASEAEKVLAALIRTIRNSKKKAKR